MNLLRLRQTPRAGLSAKTFFEDICPALLEERAELCRSLGRRYAFDLRGPGGGAWTIDFAAGAIALGVHPSDLEVTVKVDDFEALLAGDLELGEGLASHRVHVRGDLALFEQLAEFTRPKPPRHGRRTERV